MSEEATLPTPLEDDGTSGGGSHRATPADLATARRNAAKPESRATRRDSAVLSGELDEAARKHSDGKSVPTSAYAEMREDKKSKQQQRQQHTSRHGAGDNASGATNPVRRPPKFPTAPSVTRRAELPEEEFVPGHGHPPVAPSSRVPELMPDGAGAAEAAEGGSGGAGETVLPRAAKSPGRGVAHGAELFEAAQQQQQHATTTAAAAAPTAPAAADPDLESPARHDGGNKKPAPPSPHKHSTAAASDAHQHPSLARSFLVKAEPLPEGERYWASSNSNPWKDGGVGTGTHLASSSINSPNAAAGAAPPSHGRRAVAAVAAAAPVAPPSPTKKAGAAQQPTAAAASPFPFDHLVQSAGATKAPHLELKGAVDVASTHRALPGRKRATHYPQQNQHAPPRVLPRPTGNAEADANPLCNFVKIPPVKDAPKLGERTRNVQARRRQPEILHVADAANDGGATSTPGGAAARAPDALEQQAVKLLVGSDAGAPGKRGDGDSGRLVLVSPRDASPSAGAALRQRNTADGATAAAGGVAARTNMSLSRQLLRADASSKSGRGGDRFDSKPSIPAMDRPVAVEARSNEIVAYEPYDRVAAERKLQRIARVGRNTIATHDTHASRLYRQQHLPPEGFCSAENAIVQLARDHENRGGAARDIRSMESLLGVAVSHRHLQVSTRNLGLASRPVVPRSIPPPGGSSPDNAALHRAMNTTQPVYPALTARTGTDVWLRQQQQQGRGLLLLTQQQQQPENTTLALTERGREDSQSRMLALAEYQREQRSAMQNPDGVLPLMVPSALRGAPPRVVGFFRPDEQHQAATTATTTIGSNNGACFSLISPRLGAQNSATRTDLNHPTGQHLPSAPADAPRRFAELMQQRLEHAMKTATPLNVVVVAPQK